MSADRWSVCPQCGKTADAIRAERAQALTEAYGKVPMVEWEAMRAASDAPVEVTETFREDWNIGVESDGVVRVSYEGRCERCGSRAKFAHEHAIVVPA